MSMPTLVWARKLWASLDTAVSLSMTILDRYGEFEQMVRKTVSPSDYRDPLSFYLDYQAVKLLSKYPYLDTGIDRRREAIKKFLEAESQCSLTNERFQHFSEYLRIFDASGTVGRVFHRARRKIALILGGVPRLEELDFRFGPGANYGVRGDTSVYQKLSQPLECAVAFTPILPEFLGEFPGWIPEGSRRVNIVAGSELTFVPKDAKTDRPICIEPLLNGLYQKGFGSYIRKRLARFGVNLRDQSVNQRLAEMAFRSDLATVDFQSASDTISYMLVLELLPIDWFEALDVARSPSYDMEDRWYDFHKFTSMGNAYTFELESLIFFALASASCEELGIPYQTGENLSVYGDDVILPTAAFDLFSEVSSFAGFTINTEKSFSSGVFYESCGTDWFLGYNVRPILLKKRIQSLQDFYYVSNSVLSIAERIQSLSRWDDDDSIRLRLYRVRDVHAWCVGCIPRNHRLLVPKGAGDCGLHSDFDVAVPSRHEHWDGWEFRGSTLVPHRIVADFPMAYPLYHAGGSTGEGWWDCPDELLHSQGYTVRNDKRTKFRTSRMFWAGEWTNLSVKWSKRAVSLVEGIPRGFKSRKRRKSRKGPTLV